MGLLAGTWAVVGFTTLTSPPKGTSAGLGILLVAAGVAVLVPAVAAVPTRLAPAAVLVLASLRFGVTGAYHLSGGDAGWKAAAGIAGLVLGAAALYTALALELEGTTGRSVLPVGRRSAGGPGAGAPL